MKKLIAKKLTKEVIEKSLEVVQKMEEKKPVTKRNASKKVFVIKCGKCKKKKGDGENCCKCGRPWFDGKDIRLAFPEKVIASGAKIKYFLP